MKLKIETYLGTQAKNYNLPFPTALEEGHNNKIGEGQFWVEHGKRVKFTYEGGIQNQTLFGLVNSFWVFGFKFFLGHFFKIV